MTGSTSSHEPRASTHGESASDLRPCPCEADDRPSASVKLEERGLASLATCGARELSLGQDVVVATFLP